ncbi:MAG TPA: RNA polymerase sigma factor [Steroidobacteraceae bacterium]
MSKLKHKQQQYTALLEPLLAQAGAYARSILRHRHDAEDAVQQAALKGMERIGSFDSARCFKGWWFAVLRNCCIDILRSTESQQRNLLKYDQPSRASSSHEEPWQHLSIAMERLSLDHCAVLKLRYFADLSYAELAEALAIPQGTVMSRLHLARRALALQIGKDLI